MGDMYLLKASQVHS